MFTSRAEYRTLLRQDNADIRLTEKSHALGLADEARVKKVREKITQTEELVQELMQIKVLPEDVNGQLETYQTSLIKDRTSLFQLLKRPQLSIREIRELNPQVSNWMSRLSDDAIEQGEIHIKYDSYIEKERLMVEKMSRMEDLGIVPNFNYDKVPALSFEGREKLKKARPQTIGQASRISGVSPSDISVLMIHLGR